MQVIRSVRKMQTVSRQLAARGKKIAVVPTMGALHEGHLALVRRAMKEADVVITTIFVNPAQFAPHEDLAKYPRDEKSDVQKIKATLGKSGRSGIVFVPKAGEIYPDGFQTWLNVDKLSQALEGKRRPGHFRGVATVVAKLFNICRPDVAVFGMKDYQQAVVLRQMTRDLGYPVKYIIAPTVREPDGLAMSSRNRYFNERQRWEAVCLYYALMSARSMVRSGIVDVKKITKEMRAVIRATCPSAEIHYIAFTDFDTLKAVDTVMRNTVCSLSVKVHGVSLIDNMRVG
ncbi:MAG: pantoate--beta-alanine ligase [Candidatus Zixiibacteriota bacterium]